jgi:serine/threonine protein kinase
MCAWHALNHPNITLLYGYVCDQSRTPGLVCPYYAHGDIPKYIENNPSVNKLALVGWKSTKGTTRSTLPQISQIASGLEYMHTRSVVHGDLKPVGFSTKSTIVDAHWLQNNILVNDKGEASITDFGLSRVIDKTGFSTVSSGSLRCLAYELVIGEAKVTKATDVWAFGMTVLAVCIFVSIRSVLSKLRKNNF